MANENIFTTKVSDYAISRPSYAAEAIDRILSKIPTDKKTSYDINLINSFIK